MARTIPISSSMQALSDHHVESLAAVLTEAGHNPVNAFRILREYWGCDGELDFAALDIAKPTRKWLSEQFILRHSDVRMRHVSADGTIKLLIEFARGGTAECVLMPSHRDDRAAGCISSQIGCAMGCDFCASTKNGLDRSLCTGEIVEQFIHLRAEAKLQKRRIASLVFMGMGEPMHNLDHVIPAVRILGAPGLGALGKRAITISTVGVVPGIERLADAEVGVQLALSLHAPDDPTRSRLVPMNRKYSVAQIMAAARRFQERSGRPVNIEYCLLAGVNDSDDQAAMLAKHMEGFRAHVNLIPYNAIGAGLSGAIYQRPSKARIERFETILREAGVVTHVRQTRGDDVAAACGQLRQTALQVL